MTHETRLGTWVTTTTSGETVKAFVPPALPPVPEVDTSSMAALIEQAHLALGRLDGITSILPSPPLFIFMYVRKEAILSSQIEGTQSSLSDLLLFEADEIPLVPLDDVQEVSKYVAALQHGLTRMRDGFPLSLRLMREIHEVLLSSGRGASMQPGQFRKSQNWIGGTRPGNALFVPPPPERLTECLSDFEKFLHAEDGLPTLLRAALMHVQFETIHPFLDGNGRLGRLLITLLLCKDGVLKEPTLYLSLYFKTHRTRYYELLQDVRTKGDWEAWTTFFLEGVTETANSAADTAQKMLALFERDAKAIQELGRKGPAALAVHQLLQRNALVTAKKVAEETSVSAPTAIGALKALAELGIVREITGKQRHRVYAYVEYLGLLEQGTSPIVPGSRL